MNAVFIFEKNQKFVSSVAKNWEKSLLKCQKFMWHISLLTECSFNFWKFQNFGTAGLRKEENKNLKKL